MVYMIKILNEEPVALYPESKYLNDEELENPAFWVYKNPTKQEIDNIKETQPYKFVSILTLGDDYYLAYSEYFNHSYMKKSLYNVTKTSR